MRNIIRTIATVGILVAYSCCIARAYSINIMFPPVTVCETEHNECDDEKGGDSQKEIRFMIAELIMDLFE